MPEFSAIVAPKILETSVDFGPEANVEFSFDAHKVTPDWFNEQTRLLTDGDSLVVARALSSIIEKWNLTVDGESVEPSVEILSRFPIAHLGKMMEAIAEMPSRAEGEDSSALSQAPSTTSSEPQVTHQNGAATSASPKPSESLSST